MISTYDINTSNWQMSIDGIGNVVENLEDIKQCIALILTTSRGSDPLRPDFGTDIYKLVDKPISVVAPTIVSQILEGIELWESRVKLKTIRYTIDSGTIVFDLMVEYIQTGDNRTLIMEMASIGQARLPISEPPIIPKYKSFGNGFSIAFK